jgi:SnoaL-like domain
MRQDLERLATSFLDAFNSGDVKTISALVSSDVRYTGPGAAAPGVTGVDALLSAVDSLREAAPTVTGTPSRWIIDVDGGAIAGEVVWSTAEAEPPPDTATSLAGTGGPPKVPGTLILDVRDNRITGIREVHPRVSALCRLFPAPPPPPPE